jgi:hypothetical protein
MASEILTGMIPSISANDIIMWALGILIAIVAFTGVIAYIVVRIMNKRYSEYKVVIWEKDSTGNVHEYYDQAGVFLNKKTQFKLLFLRKLKKGLNPNNVPYITAKDKKGKLQKTIYLLRTGVSNYRFVYPKIQDEVIKFTVGEEDVNWAQQDYEEIVKTFDRKGFLDKYGAMLMFAFVVIIIMIILLVLFSKFGVLKEVSLAQLESNKLQLQIIQEMKNMSQIMPYPVNNGGAIITPR